MLKWTIKKAFDAEGQYTVTGHLAADMAQMPSGAEKVFRAY